MPALVQTLLPTHDGVEAEQLVVPSVTQAPPATPARSPGATGSASGPPPPDAATPDHASSNAVAQIPKFLASFMSVPPLFGERLGLNVDLADASIGVEPRAVRRAAGPSDASTDREGVEQAAVDGEQDRPLAG